MQLTGRYNATSHRWGWSRRGRHRRLTKPSPSTMAVVDVGMVEGASVCAQVHVLPELSAARQSSLRPQTHTSGTMRR